MAFSIFNMKEHYKSLLGLIVISSNGYIAIAYGKFNANN